MLFIPKARRLGRLKLWQTPALEPVPTLLKVFLKTCPAAAVATRLRAVQMALWINDPRMAPSTGLLPFFFLRDAPIGRPTKLAKTRLPSAQQCAFLRSNDLAG